MNLLCKRISDGQEVRTLSLQQVTGVGIDPAEQGELDQQFGTNIARMRDGLVQPVRCRQMAFGSGLKLRAGRPQVAGLLFSAAVIRPSCTSRAVARYVTAF